MEIVTEAFILVRSINAKVYDKYLAFFIYLTAVLLIDLLRFSVLSFHPSIYAPFYWYTEFLHATIGYAVILEISKHALNNSPGPARIARTFLWAILGAVILRVILHAVSRSVWSTTTMSTELERDLRTVQALLLAGIITFFYFFFVFTRGKLKRIIFCYNSCFYYRIRLLVCCATPRVCLLPSG